ncbi:MAG TPA: cyclic nucleotide-binding domain-containing protein [Thiolapillus brandeum]|uniref:Cyclic nucleotide-binding domain-containing protein n=1 Tax=Thiolapillus brandeum TaxID=1076588 RepID=A0A831K2A3_9GAMM|nr:cyclic nucleotide-binding domain-containing protein [Thiolapillus brandeum]
MNRILSYFSSHPWVGLSIILLVSIIASSQIGKLEVRISAEEMLVQNDEEQAFYQQVRSVFGDEQIILLYMESDDLLAHHRLEALKKTIAKLEQLPFVSRVESLFSVPWVKTVEGYLDKKPYLDKLPQTPEQAKDILQQARKNPFLKNVLLSPDQDIMAAALILEKADHLSGDWNDETITNTLNDITAELIPFYATTFSVGFPQIRTEIAERIREEQTRLFPLAVSALLIALFLLLRQFIDILLPVLTASFSILWTFGFMGAMDVPINVVTSIIPILLIIVGSTEDIHLLSEFRHAQKAGLDARASLKHMSRRMGSIVLLTFITTYLGFLSVGLSRIEVLWQFGVVASTGLALNFLATIILIPSILALAGKWQLDGKSRWYSGTSRLLAKRYWQWLWKYRRSIIVFFLGWTLVAVIGIPRLHINHNAIDSLGKNSDVRQKIELINENLAGLESLSIIVDSGIEDTFLKVRYLEELAEIQRYIHENGWSKSSTSFADYLSLLNGAFQELDESIMPESDDIVTELMIFLDHKDVRAYISEDFSRARILVRHNIESTEKLQTVIRNLRQFIDHNLDTGLNARVTGDSVLTLSATNAMISGQLQSIAILLVIIVLIISLLFTELKVGLLAALPNFFPVIVMFGFMGYMEIPLNIGTTMAAAIAIGIAVDDTLHFMLRYNRELKDRKNHNIAMEYSIYGEALPVVSTSIALIAGFLVFTQASFEPIVQFGTLGALVIATALIADFIITPLAVSTLRLVTIWDILSLPLRKRVLEKSPLFRNLKPWQIRQFLLSGSMVEYPKGQTIFRRGEVSTELFVLLTGKVEVFLPGAKDSRTLLETFYPGDVFGDVALFANIPRKTDAIAAENSTVLALSRDGIERTMRHRPLISARIFANLTADLSRRMIKLVSKQQMKNQCENDGKGGKS